MLRKVVAALFLALTVSIGGCLAIRFSAEAERQASGTPKTSSNRLYDNLDREQTAPLVDSQRIRKLEEDTDDTDDYYAAIDDDDDFEGSWIEKVYIEDGERYDDDQIHHYTARTAQNMFDESPHEWNAWEWVFFVLLLFAFGVFFSCCIMPKCCRRGY